MSRARLTVATCQFSVVADIGRNARQIVRLIGRAADQGADIAHFPEAALSGYAGASFDTWDGYDWAGLDRAMARVRAACRRHGIWAVIGTSHRPDAAGLPFNSVEVIDPRGEPVGRCDKRRCNDKERTRYRVGRRAVTFTVNGVRCGCLICLDWSFPELFRGYADDGVDLVLLSAFSAGNDGDSLHTDVVPPLMQGHAFLNCLYISVANCALPRQSFASFWVKRSGRLGARCRRNTSGLIVSAIPDDAEKDAFYAKVRGFRAAAETN